MDSPCGCQGAGDGPPTTYNNSIRWNQGVSDNQSPGPESRNRRPGPPSGGQSAVEPPGPIPNPEVKRCSADGIGTTGPVRVGRRQVFARHPQQCGCRALFLCPEGGGQCRPDGGTRIDLPASYRRAASREPGALSLGGVGTGFPSRCSSNCRPNRAAGSREGFPAEAS